MKQEIRVGVTGIVDKMARQLVPWPMPCGRSRITTWRRRLQPFFTIDEKGNDYLPYLFGSGGYLVIHKPQELPRKLPLFYARLTRE
ncbi:MAG: hypothetical protein AB2716_10755 [Candidatus Thiodiazotropha sp.]